MRTPVRAPNANARRERRVSSVRRECLDWLLILGRRHLEAILAEYVEHYNGHRPHRSLKLRPPRGATVLPAVTGGQVVRRTRMQGLINEYSRQAGSPQYGPAKPSGWNDPKTNCLDRSGGAVNRRPPTPSRSHDAIGSDR